MQIDGELAKEISKLRGEQKVTKMAISSSQERMKTELLGDMGKDMLDILNGVKKIEAPKKQQRKLKIKNWFINLFNKFN